MDTLDLLELKDLFVDESLQYVQTLNGSLLSLELKPGDAEAVHAMFRAAHSLKGNAAMMGYEELAELAHAVEDVLQGLRDGQRQVTPSLIDRLFEAIDGLQSLVSAIATDHQPGANVAVARQRLLDLASEELAGTPPGNENDSQRLEILSSIPSAIDPEMWKEGCPDVDASAGAPATPPRPVRRHPGPGERHSAELTAPAPARYLRVDVDHLDALLNVVVEMVTHRSLLDRLGKRYELPELNEALSTHGRLLSQLRDAVLEIRTVPVSQLFDRFPRMVRDLLQSQRKEAHLMVEGAGVEMDRAALDALAEPLLHLLRNAIDHGLEPPASRLASGKTAIGTLRLAAWQDHDMVVIEVSDDGRGIDPEEIAGAAVRQGIISAQEVASMSREQVLELICLPGFSLTGEVTTVSGRGVGMNAAKQQVERLRGTLKIATEPGRGSTFRLRVPIRLSLIPAVLVRVGTEAYALPMADVEQIVELEPQQIRQMDGQEMLILDGNNLPLRRLGALFDVPDAAPTPRYAVLTRPDGQLQCLCVDAVQHCDEVVVKPLPELLRNIPGLSGATILGEGQTVLIVDSAL
jgi:two-component system chemotaxis sensor kinase CheA